MWRLGKMFENNGFLVAGRGGLKKGPRRREMNLRHRILRCESLEDRRMLSADSVSDPFVLPPEPEQFNTIVSASASESPPFPLEETFLLHSLPGATKTIYLDFDGHTTTGTLWNLDAENPIDPIVTPAYTLDSDSDFSNAELERIQRVWERVVEDFIPFNVNVTTEDPGVAALSKSGGNDDEWGIRVVFGADVTDTGAGGVAFLESFNWNSDTPTFVFNESETGAAEAASHEIGHTLGLSHDGRALLGEDYYEGHGSGATGWAPIMGVGYSKDLVQWSKGEYHDANNHEDDLSIIVSQNGFSYRADDHGNVSADATALSVSDITLVSSEGIIERSSDTDYFSFTTGEGQVNLSINPFYRSPNLDILATLYDSSGEVVATSNPLDYLSASFNLELEQGDYYISVEGTGHEPSGADLGYSDYGSLGYFSISGSIVEPILSPIITVDSLLTTDYTPDLTGTINDPDAPLVLSVGSQTGLIPTNNGDGTWTLPGSSLIPLSDGVYDVVVTAINADLLQGFDGTIDELVIDTSFVFLDKFETTSFDALNWSSTGSTTIDDVGIGETSGPYAARFNGHPVGSDILTSATIDLSGATGAEFIYSYQRRGGGDSPEVGEDLVFDYLNSVGDWIELDHQLGSELDMITFNSVVISLPASALYSSFQFRVHTTSTANIDLPYDDWFVDTIGIRTTPNNPTVQFAQSNFSVSEGNFVSQVVELTRNDSSEASEVLVTVTGGTATLDSDYSGSTFTVVFAVGESSKLIPITLIDDPALEPTETIELTLSQVANSKIGYQRTSTLSVLDDGLPGDFDRNGVVNLEDNQLWRETFGDVVAPFVDADGNGNGRIDAADYSVWRDNYVPPNNLDILRTDVAPVIDGNSDAIWQGIDAMPIEFAFGNIASAADLSAQWRVLWDDTALYLYAEVTDDVLKLDSLSNVFDDDGVEFFIDPDYSHGETYDSNDAQWMLRPFGSIAYPGSPTQTTAGTEVVYATSFTGTAYAIEASIPWSALGVTPAAGSQIGIDIAVQDDDDGGDVDFSGSDGRLTWHDQQNIAGQNPSAFRSAILSSQVAVPSAASAAAIATTTTTGAASEEAIAIDVALLLDDSDVEPLQFNPRFFDSFVVRHDRPSTATQARGPFRTSPGELSAHHDQLLLLGSVEAPYAMDQESSLEIRDAAFAEDVLAEDGTDYEDLAISVSETL